METQKARHKDHFGHRIHAKGSYIYESKRRYFPNEHLLLASTARLKFDLSREKIEDDLLRQFRLQGTRSSATSPVYGTRGIIGPFHLSPRCTACALVIISISINNANLSLRGIILGNDLESESRCIVDPLPCARGWERFVRARMQDCIVHFDRSIDRSRIEDESLARAKSARSMIDDCLNISSSHPLKAPRTIFFSDLSLRRVLLLRFRGNLIPSKLFIGARLSMSLLCAKSLLTLDYN